jgi:arylsulfatase A-like enzyme
MASDVRRLLFGPILLSLCLVPGCGRTGDRPPTSARPNILFIAVDDLRPELGCYGATEVRSPGIDRLADRGVVFASAHCQEAMCNPSRASLLTGLRPDTLRLWDLYTHFRDTTPDVVTLPQHFRQNGYHAVAIGKIFHGGLEDDESWSEPKLHVDGFPLDPDAVYLRPENIALQERRKREIIAQGQQDQYVDDLGYWYLKTVATESADVPDDAYFDGAQTTVAIEKLGELRNQPRPFFLAVGYYRPHLPFNAPTRYWELYDVDQLPLATNDFLPENAPIMALNTLAELRVYTDFTEAPPPQDRPLTEAQARLLRHGYLASVSYTDTQIGRLLEALDRLDLVDSTIVVLWGDHGWKLGEHGSWCKMTNFEVDTRVPLIVSVPGTRATGRRSDRLVELVDIYPTLCELAGLDRPDHLEGTSFARLLDRPDRPWKPAVFSQFLRVGVLHAADGEEYMGRAVRTDHHLYVEWSHWPEGGFAARELYDLEADPGENVNVAGLPEQVETVDQMARLLSRGWRGARPPGPESKDAS